MIIGERIVGQDLRLSLRLLRKSPGFTVVAVVTLALSIGANAVAFGVFSGLILNPLNVPREQSLYALQRGSDNYPAQSYPDYRDVRDRNRSFDSLAAFSPVRVGLNTGGDKPTRAWCYLASGNYFDTLGIQPYLGRFFHASDERGPNSAPYIVLSYTYWQNHFLGDRGVVGRNVRLNNHPYTIIGVAPPGFRGTILFFSPAFYVPVVNVEQLEGENILEARGKPWVFMTMGHLKAGVTPEQAIADLNSIGSYLEKTYPKETGPATFSLAPPGLYGDFLGRPVRAFVMALMLLAGLILLAACANLGSLFAARVADRSREIALRLALGSSRIRILQQLFAESVLVALIGGAAGLLGSIVVLRWLSAWQPFPKFPFVIPLNPDANVYAVALLLAIASGLLFGVVPIRQILRTDPYQIIKSGSIGTGRRRIAIRDLLLATQIAICTLLVTSSMVAVRGLARSLRGHFGVEPQRAMLVETDLRMAGYTGDTATAMRKRMVDTMQTVAGVESVGLIDIPPLTLEAAQSLVFTDETVDLRLTNAAANPYTYNISPEYFHAAGTALLAGRALTWHDDKDLPRVAVVNREFARKVFGSVTNAEGRYYKRQDGARIQVVGIVEDGKYLSLTEDPQPAMFLPILQSPSSITRVWLVARSNGGPQQLAAAMQSTLRGLDSEMPYYMATWNKEMDGVLFPARVATAALGVLGVMGAVLSIAGIFGMAAYSVSKRQRELGIRIAIGGGRKEVLQAALGRSFKLLVFGSAAGLVLGVLAGQVLASVVYQATPRDPLVLAGVVLVMLLLGLLATWIPAQRALSVDPLILLRTE
jgi:predicted permease